MDVVKALALTLGVRERVTYVKREPPTEYIKDNIKQKGHRNQN